MIEIECDTSSLLFHSFVLVNHNDEQLVETRFSLVFLFPHVPSSSSSSSFHIQLEINRRKKRHSSETFGSS